MDGFRIHGGGLAAARAAFPDAPEPWIDLSTGINPRPWNIVSAGPIDWTRLPEPEAIAALEQTAADHFGVVAERVCAVPGSELALRLIGGFDLPRPRRWLAPGYGSYAEALADAMPIAAGMLDREAARGGTILLGNPNNPDGRIVPADRLRAIAQGLAARGGRLIVDEAFADALAGASILPHAGDTTIVLRSFGKFFGLAGLRLGFVVAAPEWLVRLRRMLGAWPVSAGAVTIGTAACRDRGWIEEARRRLPAQAAELDALLARHGLVGQGACPLFRLVRTSMAQRLFSRLAGGGILTRPFAAQPDWLRFGLPADAGQMDRLDVALGRG